MEFETGANLDEDSLEEVTNSYDAVVIAVDTPFSERFAGKAVFICGDRKRSPGSAVRSMALGKKTAFEADKFLKGELPGSTARFNSRIGALLEGEVEETHERRRVVLKRNEKDPAAMEMLEAALAKLSGVSLRTLSGRKYEFSLS